MRHIELKHKTFSCEACSAVFRQKRNLFNHLRNHFEKYICEFCSLQFNYEKLQQHIITVHEPHKRELTYDCRHCERKFPSAIFRNCHERDVHKGREDDAFKCPACQIVFLKKDQLRLHNLENHHSGSIFFCAYKDCDRYFKNAKLLKIHEQVHGPASYECLVSSILLVLGSFCYNLFNISRNAEKSLNNPQITQNTRRDVKELSNLRIILKRN